jgi:O-antigen/teichoic acid export membrane protein
MRAPMTEPSLKNKTILSLFWSFIDKFGQQLLNFLSMLILMNIVAAEDYGKIGSLALFIAFSSILIDSGFGRALLNRQNLTNKDYSTVFIFNVLFSVLLYSLLYISAPFLGELFNSPEITLIARIVFISIVLNGLGLIQQTILTKKADFKGLSKINITALLIANIIAIVMALYGFGVWALVAQTLVYALFRTIFLWIYSNWRPALNFSFNSLKSFFAFSSKLLLTNTIASIGNNIYPSLIALFYPMNQVAYFNQAKKYQEIPFLAISNTFRSVAMLILSETNNENERMKRIVSKMMKSIAFIAFPLGFIMILLAEPLFYLFFKEKWLSSVPFFQALTLAGMISPFVYIFNELFIAKERSAYFLGVEILKAVLLIALIVLLLPKGLMALAASWVLYILATLLISVILSSKLVKYNLLNFLTDTIPYMLTALICSSMSFLITNNITPPILYILINILIITTLYIATCKLLRLEMIKEIEVWFTKRKNK